MSPKSPVLGVSLAVALIAGCATMSASPGEFGAGAVNHARQLNADSEPGTWMSDGRTYSQQRFSPLTQINAENVGQLGLAWYGDLDTQNGQESTPVVVDGVLYITTAWSMVKAYDAKTGRRMWEYDPKVDRAKKAPHACCDVVNRGVAVRNGMAYLGTLDGRLIALDTRTGNEIWSVQTTPPERAYTITGVPQLTPNLVVIGNAGAEYDVRGYITAYDAKTGKQVWRFYTVPGDPSKPFEHEMLKEAAATWNGEWWKLGGGATAWDDILYDPKTDMIYFGTGNGLAWAQELRSPGGGDNLFVSSIIALDAKTGRYRWHYQQVPGDEWDYDNTNPLMTAELNIDGRERHVLMQSPKQGFFYVWDAKTGELISANKHAPLNWATHVDLKTGRPVINPEVRYSSRGQPAIVFPAALGAHNWHPMAYSPQTKLVYIPITESITAYGMAENFEFQPNRSNTGVARTPGVQALFDAPGAPRQGSQRSYIQAWDPVAGKEVWRWDNDPRVQAGQTLDPKTTPPIGYGASGLMVTATDLVFSGNHLGEFAAYDARTGKRLWSAPTQARTVAAPSTYMIDGEQYVAILVGARGRPDNQPQTNYLSATNARILVFKLGATATLPTTPIVTAGATAPAQAAAPPAPPAAAPGRGAAPVAVAAPATAAAGARQVNPPLFTGSNEEYLDGEVAYSRYCAGCHGDDAVGSGQAPDLRYSPTLASLDAWNAVVLGGSRAANGMPSFRGTLSDDAASDVRHYLIRRANVLKDQQAAGR